MSVSLEDRSRSIRARMQLLRGELEQDATRLARNTNELLNWRDYVTQFPAGALAIALIAGFLLVPGRKVVKSVQLTEDSVQNLLEKQSQAGIHTASKGSPVLKGLFRVMTGVAINGLRSVAHRKLDRFVGGRGGVNDTQTFVPGDGI